MYQRVIQKLKTLFIEKLPLCCLILCSVGLSGCGLLEGLPSFPIESLPGLMGDYFEERSQKVASAVVYVILVGVFTTIPLYMAKCFENLQLYKFYKLFWWIASLVFANLFLLLRNVLPQENQYGDYIVLSLVLVIVILVPTLAPAAYQYKKKKNHL